MSTAGAFTPSATTSGADAQIRQIPCWRLLRALGHEELMPYPQGQDQEEHDSPVPLSRTVLGGHLINDPGVEESGLQEGPGQPVPGLLARQGFLQPTPERWCESSLRLMDHGLRQQSCLKDSPISRRPLQVPTENRPLPELLTTFAESVLASGWSEEYIAHQGYACRVMLAVA